MSAAIAWVCADWAIWASSFMSSIAFSTAARAALETLPGSPPTASRAACWMSCIACVSISVC